MQKNQEFLQQNFMEINVPLRNVYHALRSNNQTYGLTTPNLLSHLYQIPKLHKGDEHRSLWRPICGKAYTLQFPHPDNPTSRAQSLTNKKRLRFLAPSVETATSGVAVLLAQFLAAVIDILLLKDKQHIKQQGVRRCWIARTTDELFDDILHFERTSSTQHVQVHDFTAMYTALPHDKIITRVTKVIEEAMLHVKRLICPDADNINPLRDIALHLASSTDKTSRHSFLSWGFSEKPSPAGHWGYNEAITALQYVVRNTIVHTNGKLYKQTSGVGMGCEASDRIATLWAYACESEFVDAQLLHRPIADIRKACNCWLTTSRYIDDRTSIYDDSVRDYASYWPSANDYDNCALVKASDSKPAPRVAIALGLRIQENQRRFIVATRDKQTAFNFQILRYPTPTSTLQRSVSVAALIGIAFSRT